MSGTNKMTEIIENATNEGGKKGNTLEMLAFGFMVFGAEEAARGLVKLVRKGINKVFPKQEVVEEPENSGEVAETTEEK